MSIRNRSSLHAIGERSGVAVVATGSDVWYGTDSAVTVPPSGGEQMQIVSDDPNDTAGGSGIQEVMIHYLDVNGDNASETIATSGTTAVDTIAVDMRFIQNIHASKVGSNLVAEGNITIHSKNIGGNPVYNMIELGGNMSLTINKMVPAGKTLYITHWDASAAGKQSVVMRLRSTDIHGDLFQDVFLFKDSVFLENSSFVRRWTDEEIFPIPEFSLVKVSVWCSNAGADVSAGWSGRLEDNA
ncbi:MAG: hypothetical protein KAJ19_23620 [Gammaproteobacteria bacterium]|nr:hypothetical protein [Gammaproteobacteria bacterium]